MSTLFLSEIFYSLQGEGLNTGLPTIFIRLAGCPLRCPYCDTKYALTIKNGKKTAFAIILKTLKKYPCKGICLTGGEPLWQKNSIELIKLLIKNGYSISIETSGAVPIKDVPKEAEIVMDLKTPSSRHENRNLMENLAFLKTTDSIKFVIGNKKDFDWSIAVIKKYRPNCNLLISPIWEMKNKIPVAEWIKKNPYNLRLSLQMHKVLNIE